MDENEGADDDQHAEEAPPPEGSGAAGVIDVAGGEFLADAVSDVVEPDETGDAERQGGDDQEHERSVQGVPAVAGRSDQVDFGRDVGEREKRVEAERDDAEHKPDEKTAAGGELANGLAHGIPRCPVEATSPRGSGWIGLAKPLSTTAPQAYGRRALQT